MVISVSDSKLAVLEELKSMGKAVSVSEFDKRSVTSLGQDGFIGVAKDKAKITKHGKMLLEIVQLLEKKRAN